MADNDPQTPRLSLEADFLAERKKNLDLQARLELLEQKYKAQGEQLSRERKRAGAQSEPKQELQQPATEPKPVAKQEQAPVKDPQIHAMSITDAFCPGCGTKNEEFKDETECKNCGHGLGAIATISQVKACPGCGLSKMPDGSPLAKKKARIEVPRLG